MPRTDLLPARRPSGPARPAPRADRPGPGPRAPRRSRRGPLLLALVLLLAVGAAVGGWYFGVGRYTATPGVINLSRAQAADKVEAAGLVFEVGSREYSETVPAGSVISTDPGAGTRILPDGTVTAVLSRGAERYAVPQVRGMTEDEAQHALDEANLTFGESIRRFHEKVAAGVVLSADPDPGAELRPGRAVDLVVSKGPRPIKVPDVTGRDAAAAEEKLTELKLAVEASSEHSDTVPEGRVISQSPSSGTLFRGDTVELVVSEGPVMVEIPGVKGVGVEQATAIMEEAGFEVRTERSDLYVGLEYVVGTDPEKGSMVPRGSTVTLFLV